MKKLLQKLEANASPVLLANLAMLVTTLAWGTSFISTKIAVAEIPPVTLAFLRFFAAAVLLYCVMRKLEPDAALRRGSALPVALAGFVGITAYFCLENTGIRLTSASNASLITSVNPILSIALNFAVFRARLTWLECAGVLLGGFGAYLTVIGGDSVDFASDHFRGNLFMLGAMVTWAIYTILSKKLQRSHSGVALVTYQTIFGAAMLAPLSLLEYSQWQFFSFHTALQIVFLAVVCSAAGYFLYVYALKILDVAVTTLYLNLIPVVGVLSGCLVLGETMPEAKLVGGAIVIAAIFIANLDKTLRYFKR